MAATPVWEILIINNTKKGFQPHTKSMTTVEILPNGGNKYPVIDFENEEKSVAFVEITEWDETNFGILVELRGVEEAERIAIGAGIEALKDVRWVIFSNKISDISWNLDITAPLIGKRQFGIGFDKMVAIPFGKDDSPTIKFTHPNMLAIFAATKDEWDQQFTGEKVKDGYSEEVPDLDKLAAEIQEKAVERIQDSDDFEIVINALKEIPVEKPVNIDAISRAAKIPQDRVDIILKFLGQKKEIGIYKSFEQVFIRTKSGYLPPIPAKDAKAASVVIKESVKATAEDVTKGKTVTKKKRLDEIEDVKVDKIEKKPVKEQKEHESAKK